MASFPIFNNSLNNEKFRSISWTGYYGQLVLMSLNPQEIIPYEVHKDADQIIRIEYGDALVTVNGEFNILHEGDLICIPAGVGHKVYNPSDTEKLKLSTIYCGKPQH